MPRYFFDIEDHVRDCDEEGTLFDGPAIARTEAVTFAGAYLRDNPDLLDDGCPFIVNVHDDTGARIVRIIVRAEEPGRRP